MKKYSTFLVCLLLSFGAWFFFNMSQTFSEVVSVEVIASSNIDGYSSLSSQSSSISARCRATGFRMSRMLRSSSRPVPVEISSSDLQPSGDGWFVLPSALLHKYSAQIFGAGVSVEDYITSDASFNFKKENFKKVPVVIPLSVQCRPQYMKAGGMKVVPDSVLVYGDEDMVASIERVMTRPLNFNDVHSDLEGVARLDRQRGLRYSAPEVKYSQEIARYVEIGAAKKVETRNVPSGRTLKVYPSEVNVKFRCRYPLQEDPSLRTEVYVDYREFSGSISGKCLTDCDNLPAGVLDFTIEPALCDCFEIIE